MTLSLVVPVYNDRAGVQSVVRQALELNIFHQIILSDDASDQPLCADDFADALSHEGLDLQILRSDQRQGAGAARNRALEQVTGDYLLFFDSDDLLRPDLAVLWDKLQSQTDAFDFCIFHHAESREASGGMFPVSYTHLTLPTIYSV